MILKSKIYPSTMRKKIIPSLRLLMLQKKFVLHFLSNNNNIMSKRIVSQCIIFLASLNHWWFCFSKKNDKLHGGWSRKKNRWYAIIIISSRFCLPLIIIPHSNMSRCSDWIIHDAARIFTKKTPHCIVILCSILCWAYFLKF